MRVLDNHERWLSWWDGKVRSLLFDLVLAVFCGAELVSEVGSSSPLVISAFVVSGLGLFVRRRFPEAAVVAAAPVLAISESPLPASIALYTFARRRGPRPALWLVGGAAIASQVVAEMIRQQGWHGFSMLVAIAVKAAVYSAPLVLGLWLHQRRVLLVAVRERVERVERERELLADQAVADERRRVAREMHDVVAHRVSALSLQAGALTVRTQDEHTGETAEIIRQNSAKALTELRGMLRVLRDTDGTAEDSTDAPTVRGIETLVGDAVTAGATVRLDIPAVLPETSGTVGRAAYRVVQEALTNAAKHAPNAAIRVDVAVADDDLVITVSNERGLDIPSRVAGPGYGLLGMRERVTLVGGSLETGPTDNGGYEVRAVLPLRAPEEPTGDLP